MSDARKFGQLGSVWLMMVGPLGQAVAHLSKAQMRFGRQSPIQAHLGYRSCLKISLFFWVASRREKGELGADLKACHREEVFRGRMWRSSRSKVPSPAMCEPGVSGGRICV